MMIAVVIENFKSSIRNDSYHVRPAHTEEFVEVWATFDPVGIAQLPVMKLPELLAKLPPPLGPDPAKHGGRLLKKHISSFILSLDIEARRAARAVRRRCMGRGCGGLWRWCVARRYVVWCGVVWCGGCGPGDADWAAREGEDPRWCM